MPECKLTFACCIVHSNGGSAGSGGLFQWPTSADTLLADVVVVYIYIYIYIYSKESYGESMAEEVYIDSGSHPSTRS